MSRDSYGSVNLSRHDRIRYRPTEMWFAIVRSQQLGPLSELAVAELVRVGEAAPQTPVWTRGMPTWQPMGSIPVFSDLFGAGNRSHDAEEDADTVMVAPDTNRAWAELLNLMPELADSAPWLQSKAGELGRAAPPAPKGRVSKPPPPPTGILGDPMIDDDDDDDDQATAVLNLPAGLDLPDDPSNLRPVRPSIDRIVRHPAPSATSSALPPTARRSVPAPYPGRGKRKAKTSRAMWIVYVLLPFAGAAAMLWIISALR